MKYDAIIVRETEGERRLAFSELPLRLGTGNDCQIRLPGPGSAAFALIDELDGEPFVQPIGHSHALKVNGDSLAASRRLATGDELEFFGTRVVVGESGDALTLDVRLEGSAYVTRPPELDAVQPGSAEETIVATAFKRAADVAPAETGHSGHRWQIAVGGAVAALMLLSWLLFTSKSIQFDVQPAGADSVQVTGGWFKLPVGERILMREGTYTVSVTKSGYYDVSQTLEVDEAPSRTVTR